MASGGGSDYKSFPWWKKVLLSWTPAGAEYFSNWIDDWGVEPIVVMPLVLLGLFGVAYGSDSEAAVNTFAMVVALSPVWLPLYLLNFFWTTWMHYIRFIFWFSQKHVLLEIQLPPEVEKSPAAMELFLTSLWNSGGESTFIARVWEGKFRPIWSLEIASTEGQVKFYLHLRAAQKNIVEARLYGQYPEARVSVVDDYATKIPYKSGEYEWFGLEYGKSNPHALPIRTYIDYALDKNTDTPEVQVDPITNLLEFMGSIGPGEHLWLQIIMKARKKDEWYGIYVSKDSWAGPARKKIQEITKGAIKRAGELTDDPLEKKKVGSRGATLLTGGEKLQVEAIERSLTKNVFECGIRGMYVAKKGNFDGVNIGALIQLFNPYRYPEFGSLGPGGGRGRIMFDYPWQDIGNLRMQIVNEHLFFNYRQRAYFYVPYDQVPVFMTTEEIATLWHFPSSVVKTPGIDRVPSRRAEAPINLPI